VQCGIEYIDVHANSYCRFYYCDNKHLQADFEGTFPSAGVTY